MRAAIARLAGGLCLGWLAACATDAPPTAVVAEMEEAPRSRSVAVVGNGWHTAIVIARPELLATGQLPEAQDFPEAAFLEFGWGDRTYYQAREKTLGMTLDAALTPTPAVMHVAGLPRWPAPGATHGADAEVQQVRLTEQGFRELVASIAADFERPDGGRAAAVAAGLRPDSRFYAAHGRFHLFNTCNTWAARKLRIGGVPLSAAGVVTADELMARLRRANPAAQADVSSEGIPSDGACALQPSCGVAS